MRPVAIVLAAGTSRRAGSVNKLLARDGRGRRMIVRSVTTALRCRADAVVVVLGSEKAAIAASLSEAGLTQQQRLHLAHVSAQPPALSVSLHTGLARAIELGADAALICLGDMPLVQPSTLDRLIERLDRDPEALACVPSRQGIRGNPLIWRRTLFEALLSLTGDRGARLLLEAHAARVREVAVEDGGILQDFDTPERLAEYAADASTFPETHP